MPGRKVRSVVMDIVDGAAAVPPESGEVLAVAPSGYITWTELIMAGALTLANGSEAARVGTANAARVAITSERHGK